LAIVEQSNRETLLGLIEDAMTVRECHEALAALWEQRLELSIGEAPDDETMTAAALAISGEGNVRTTTLRPFNPEETRAIIAEMP
jgi:GYD domain